MVIPSSASAFHHGAWYPSQHNHHILITICSRALCLPKPRSRTSFQTMSVPHGWREQRLPVTNPDPTKLKQELDDILGVGKYKMSRKGAGRVVVVSPNGLSDKQLETLSEAFYKPRQPSQVSATMDNLASPPLSQQRSNLGPDEPLKSPQASEQPSEKPETPSPTNDSAKPPTAANPEPGTLQRRRTLVDIAAQGAESALRGIVGIVRVLTLKNNRQDPK